MPEMFSKYGRSSRASTSTASPCGSTVFTTLLLVSAPVGQLTMHSPQETHDEAMLDEAIERVRAYAEAGASGFFVPMLGDLGMLSRLCAESSIPVNFMTYPGCPSNAEVAATGVARISHGPFPHMALMGQLEEAARKAFA